jgi:hypothetical protein
MGEPRSFVLPHTSKARVAELADALASGASSRKGVEVRVLSRAPNISKELGGRGQGRARRLVFSGASFGASWSFRQTLDRFAQVGFAQM